MNSRTFGSRERAALRMAKNSVLVKGVAYGGVPARPLASPGASARAWT